jgi:hypothetical protein
LFGKGRVAAPWSSGFGALSAWLPISNEVPGERNVFTPSWRVPEISKTVKMRSKMKLKNNSLLKIFKH